MAAALFPACKPAAAATIKSALVFNLLLSLQGGRELVVLHEHALDYYRTVQGGAVKCGLIMCPATSYVEELVFSLYVWVLGHSTW